MGVKKEVVLEELIGFIIGFCLNVLGWLGEVVLGVELMIIFDEE